MVTEASPKMVPLRCKGFNEKTGRECNRLLLMVLEEHKAQVLARIQIKCTVCNTMQ